MIELFELRRGKASENLSSFHWDVDCTLTLVKVTYETGSSNILFDTGGSWKSEELLKSLGNEKVDFVLCSHGHSDHVGCLSLFQDAKLQVVGRDINNMKGEYKPAILTPQDTSIGALMYELTLGDRPLIPIRFYNAFQGAKDLLKIAESPTDRPTFEQICIKLYQLINIYAPTLK
jgi:glyoxylase-like metal-dependent hydrolase (beta-lactamase superfamily II)